MDLLTNIFVFDWTQHIDMTARVSIRDTPPPLSMLADPYRNAYCRLIETDTEGVQRKVFMIAHKEVWQHIGLQIGQTIYNRLGSTDI